MRPDGLGHPARDAPAGKPFYVPDAQRAAAARSRTRRGRSSFVDGARHGRREPVALLYVDSFDPHFCTAQDLERLSKFSRIIAKAVGENVGVSVERAPEPARRRGRRYLERTPVEDMEREKLLLLLNRNEWNIARVARLMGVTRRTIYLRLQRYNIPRERVPKTRPPPRASRTLRGAHPLGLDPQPRSPAARRLRPDQPLAWTLPRCPAGSPCG